MRRAIRQRLRLSGDTELAFVTAGDPSAPAVLLLHGFPGLPDYFRSVMPTVSQVTHVSRRTCPASAKPTSC